MRTLVVGDLHGKVGQLKQLIDLALTSHKDLERVIFLGDYCDHRIVAPGKTSTKELITYLVELEQSKVFKETHFLRGNHDVWFSQWMCSIMRGIDIPKTIKTNWMLMGGRETLLSYDLLLPADNLLSLEQFYTKIPSEHIRFYQKLNNILHDRDLLAVHGGLPYSRFLNLDDEDLHASIIASAAVALSGANIPAELLDIMQWERKFIAEGYGLYDKMLPNIARRWIFVGHTSKQELTKKHGDGFYANMPEYKELPVIPWANPESLGTWICMDVGQGHLAGAILDPSSNDFPLFITV
jgi:hypothetical protein